MCHFQTLFHDDSIGYVVRCAACEKIQVGFSNVMLTIDEEEFISLLLLLDRVKEEQQWNQHNPSVRCIVLPTQTDGVKLLLSYNELVDFAQMIEQADNELKSLALIKLFEKS